MLNIKYFHYLENLLKNDHETPERTKPSTSISRYQNKSGKYSDVPLDILNFTWILDRYIFWVFIFLKC